MALNTTNMSLLRRAQQGFYLDATQVTAPNSSTKYVYGYVTNDAAATVEGAGYFDSEIQLAPGDIIEAVMAVASTPVLKTYVVTANNLASSGHIVIALQTTTSG